MFNRKSNGKYRYNKLFAYNIHKALFYYFLNINRNLFSLRFGLDGYIYNIREKHFNKCKRKKKKKKNSWDNKSLFE